MNSYRHRLQPLFATGHRMKLNEISWSTSLTSKSGFWERSKSSSSSDLLLFNLSSVVSWPHELDFLFDMLMMPFHSCKAVCEITIRQLGLKLDLDPIRLFEKKKMQILSRIKWTVSRRPLLNPKRFDVAIHVYDQQQVQRIHVFPFRKFSLGWIRSQSRLWIRSRSR